MASAVPLADLSRKALDVHARIFADLAQVSRAVDALQPDEPDPLLFEQAWAQIDMLERQARDHFRNEEAAGMPDRLRALLPDAAAEILGLQVEHTEILDLVDRMRDRSRRCSPLAVMQLAEDVALLLDKMYAHEAMEDRLMAAALASADTAVDR
ncbi:MAG: hemerythrin domain-containing protein [Deltaproteobacteria bacterium]|nr:hemerythrin domain-containing protein [Deltaproteobacteria bacterium]